MMDFKRVIAIFLIGFLMGLATMNLVHMRTLDRLYLIQNQLTNQLLDREIKLEGLKESLQKAKTIVIKDVVINLEFEGNPLVKDEIERNIRFYLSDLIGQELWRIEGEMLYKILDNRIIDVDHRRIRLKVKYIVISEEIAIGVKAEVMEKL